ncbi:hypothetical protein P8452_59403 [Trifolium repens]|nr:hypothetical protein P8452_59403 [Trifolium repens]
MIILFSLFIVSTQIPPIHIPIPCTRDRDCPPPPVSVHPKKMRCRNELFTIPGNNTSPSPATTQHHELIQPSSTFNRNKQQKDENKTGEIKKTSQRTASSMNWPKGAKAQEVAKIMDLRIA